MNDPPRGQADGGAGAAPAHIRWRDYGAFLRTPSWMLCTLGMTAMTFAIGGIAFWMPYYLAHKPGAPASATAIFGVVICVAGLVGTLLGGMTADKLRARFPGSYFLVSGIAMLVGFPFVLLTLSASFPLIWVWLFVRSITSARSPASARQAARLMAVVVLPTPPFWFASA